MTSSNIDFNMAGTHPWNQRFCKFLITSDKKWFLLRFSFNEMYKTYLLYTFKSTWPKTWPKMFKDWQCFSIRSRLTASSLGSGGGVWKLVAFQKCAQIILVKSDKVSNSNLLHFLCKLEKTNNCLPNPHQKTG